LAPVHLQNCQQDWFFSHNVLIDNTYILAKNHSQKYILSLPKMNFKNFQKSTNLPLCWGKLVACLGQVG
jgi:hypothetical protein